MHAARESKKPLLKRWLYVFAGACFWGIARKHATKEVKVDDYYRLNYDYWVSLAKALMKTREEHEEETDGDTVTFEPESARSYTIQVNDETIRTVGSPEAMIQALITHFEAERGVHGCAVAISDIFYNWEPDD